MVRVAGVVVLGVEVVVKTSFLPPTTNSCFFIFTDCVALVLPDVGYFTGFGELVAIYNIYSRHHLSLNRLARNMTKGWLSCLLVTSSP